MFLPFPRILPHYIPAESKRSSSTYGRDSEAGTGFVCGELPTFMVNFHFPFFTLFFAQENLLLQIPIQAPECRNLDLKEGPMHK